MKRIISAALLLSLIISSCSKKNESKEEDKILDSTVIQGDTLIIDNDTIVNTKADSTSLVEAKVPKSNAYIVVDKPKLKLYVIEGSDTLFTGGICCARNRGNKKFKDDRRTPEGEFHITNIHDASGWLYEGRIPHVYGPWFLRLSADGWQGIGIHGTNAPYSIGSRSSKGCIRMRNEDIEKVHDLAFEGMKVIILPDADTGGAGFNGNTLAKKTKEADTNTKKEKGAPNEQKSGETENKEASEETPVATPDAPNEAPVKNEPAPSAPEPSPAPSPTPSAPTDPSA